MSKFKKILFLALVLLTACAKAELKIEADKAYTTKEDVALYIHLYEELPPNYLTKAEALALGWEAEKGNLWDVSDRMSIIMRALSSCTRGNNET